MSMEYGHEWRVYMFHFLVIRCFSEITSLVMYLTRCSINRLVDLENDIDLSIFQTYFNSILKQLSLTHLMLYESNVFSLSRHT